MPHDPEQPENLERVSTKIALAIMQFCEGRIRARQLEFDMATLVRHIQEAVPNIAPDSPSRILRSLRQAGKISYIVVSRADSKYCLIPDGPIAEEQFVSASAAATTVAPEAAAPPQEAPAAARMPGDDPRQPPGYKGRMVQRSLFDLGGGR